MSRRPAVLYLCFDTVPSPKGAGTHIHYFVSALARHYDVTLMSIGRDAVPENASYAGARHLVVPLPQENYLDRALAYREAVWDELERTRYDIVHWRTSWAALPIAEEKARQGFRVVGEVNAVESIELKYHYPALRSAPELLAKLRAQEGTALQCSDALVTPSQVTQHYLISQRLPAERITVIPNGVDLTLFQPDPYPSPAYDPLTLLYIGTLAPWQGIDLLLDALRLATARRPLRLRILGPAARKWVQPLEKRVRKLGLAEVVTLLPPVPHAEVPAIIRAADICVAPLAPTERNLTQGCHPLKILEYLACGKPVVASDLPVIRDILVHGETALLCKLDKPVRLADAILRLADDAALRDTLGLNAARVARERFDWAQAQQALLAVYAELANNPS